MKVYKIKVNLDDITGMDAISLVEYPATQVDFLKFNDEKPVELQFNDEKNIITGPIMLCDTPIYRNNSKFGEHYVVFDAETIRTMIEKYSIMGLNNSVNLDHDNDRFTDGAIMIESYIKDSTRGIVPNEFTNIPDGSWIASFKITDMNLWDEIKQGEFKGFSLQGLFQYGEEVEMASQKPEDEEYDDLIDRLVKDLEDMKVLG